MAQKGLGRGLGALLGDSAEETNDFEYVAISHVEPRLDQPRSSFSEPELQELADSIAEHGILQPLTVRSMGDGYYQIIAGERRWRAARMAGIENVPVRVITADDKRAMELALVENLQRDGLNAIEEAKGYKTLMQKYGLTQEEVASRVGKSRPVIANAVRLLSLPDEVVKMLEDGELAPGAARTLIAIDDEELIIEAAKRIVENQLNVRMAEQLASRLLKEKQRREKEDEIPEKLPELKVDYIAQIQEQLRKSLGRRIKVTDGKKRGKIEIEYYGYEDMNRLIEALQSLGDKKEYK